MRQRELAMLCGCSESLISLILSGARRPSWELANAIAEKTGSGVRLWMEGTAEEKKAALKAAENGGGDF